MKSSQHQDFMLSYEDLEGLGIKSKTDGHRGQSEKNIIPFIKDDKRMSRRRMVGKSDYDKQQGLGQTQGHFTLLGLYANENHLHKFNLVKVILNVNA